jgi:hypothetical protein
MSETPLTAAQVQQAEQNVSNEGIVHQALVSIDQSGNVILSPILFLQRGLPDETISSHVRRIVDDPTAKHKLVADVINRLLDAIQPEHGALAEAGDAERAKEVETIEDESLGAA